MSVQILSNLRGLIGKYLYYWLYITFAIYLMLNLKLNCQQQTGVANWPFSFIKVIPSWIILTASTFLLILSYFCWGDKNLASLKIVPGNSVS